jgi:ribosomal protein L17
MYAAVSVADLRALVKKLVEMALDGDVAAAREVLQRCLGPAESVDILSRLDNLEEKIGGRNER